MFGNNDIELKNVICHFPVPGGAVKAVNDVSLTLREGDITGLIGESGCGKSVLGMAILGLNPPYVVKGGHIFYHGEDLMHVKPSRMRHLRGREIGLIPQNPGDSMNPVRRIRSQITESLKVGLTKRSPVPRSASVNHGKPRRSTLHRLSEDLLCQFGFERKEAERVSISYPFELSGGMQQRAIAAIGMASRPSFVIADEPTKGLDDTLRTEMYEILQTAASQDITGMLIITHDIAMARELCTRLLVMYAGEILEDGENVLLNPLHPYTQGLTASLPENGMHPMEGSAPAPYDKIFGCVFYDRCPYAQDRCARRKPPYFEVNGSRVKCFLFGKEQ